jgi:fucose permease
MNTPSFVRTRFTWLAYSLLAFYGYYLNIIGPVTPFLKDELNLSYTVSSFHYTAFALGMILAGLTGHLVIQRFGRQRSLWIGAFGMSLGALALIAMRVPAVTIGASFLMGLIGSLTLAVVPSSLSDQYGEQRAVAISEANVVSSLICTAAPLLVGWFSYTPAGWRAALLLAAFAPLIMRFAFGKVAFPPNLSKESQPKQGHPALPARYWVYWCAIVLAVSAEFCMISWSADYMEKQLALSKAAAAQSVSLFLAGMILGRWAASRLVQRFSSVQVVSFSTLLAAAGFLLFWTAPLPWIGLAGLFLSGLGIASMYPLILSLAIGSAGNNTVQASARSSLASGTAILALPLLLGRLADMAGIHSAYAIVLVLLAGVLLIIQLTARYTLVAQPTTN